MRRVLYSGFDTLDVSFQGALPDLTLAHLSLMKQKASATKRDQPIEIGPGPFRGVLKQHGMSGGYAFVFNNGPTGAIFSIKDNPDTREWNIGVSVRALRLLTHGYEATKQWIIECLKSMGCRLQDHSVRRLDFAIDIYAPGFELDMANFIAPAQSKISPMFSKEQDLDDEGNRPSAVIRGRSFESVTIGRMPGRQFCVYDKRRAAIDMGQPYWFEAWGVNPSEPNLYVLRVEIRAGRDALAKRMLKRSFNAVEADIGSFVSKALSDVRYVTDKNEQLNATRTTEHEIWDLARKAACTIPFDQREVLLEERALKILRQQRYDLAMKQGIGCLLNALILDGVSPEEIASQLPMFSQSLASDYADTLGNQLIFRKAHDIKARLRPLLDRAHDYK